MGLGMTELCFQDSTNGVFVRENFHVLSVFEAAAILMEISNSGAGDCERNRKRKRSPSPAMKKTESPFTLETPMCMRNHMRMISAYPGTGAVKHVKNRKGKRVRAPAPPAKKQSKKKTESPLIPETPTAMGDKIEKKGGKPGGADEQEKNRKRKRGQARGLSPATAPARKKQSKKKTEPPSNSEIPTAMRDQIEKMGGNNIELVIEKELNDTDLNKNHGRLLLPPKMVRTEFMTEEEEKVLEEKEGKKKKGMKVVIMDDVVGESLICLKKWKIGSDEAYCLMTQWNSFVEKSGIKSGDSIQLWSFRKDCFDDEKEAIVSKLCFAMVKLGRV